MLSAKIREWIFAGIFTVLVFFAVSIPAEAHSQEKNPRIDSKRCVVLIRAGKEAFERGKYIISLGYFKKAIQADPRMDKAWHWYNVTLSYALAERSRQISYPDLKVPESSGIEAGVPFPDPAPPVRQEVPGMEDEEEDMEGC